MQINEDILQYIWRFQLFAANKKLCTTGGEELTILNPGEHNTDAGPDFFNAKIRIGQTVLVGNIEVHTYSSLWNIHGHDKDKAYGNLILHVVFENDKSVNGLACLELKDLIPQELMERYGYLMRNEAKIACSAMFERIDTITVDLWLERMLVERLAAKTEAIEAVMKDNQNNWEEAFYILLARNFGFKVNAQPFEMLARSLPLKILAKVKNDLLKIEALLFGQAGFLNGDSDEKYFNDLKQEYIYLKKLYGLNSLDEGIWKFMRLRPANFPTLRIAQFARLIYGSVHLFSRLMEIRDWEVAGKLFNCQAGIYWSNHFRFGQVSVNRKKNIGEPAVQNIFINTVLPFMFYYGKRNNDQELETRALEGYTFFDAEKNVIISNWLAAGFKPQNAGQSQALIQLYTHYCKPRKCLQCGIGNKLLNKQKN